MAVLLLFASVPCQPSYAATAKKPAKVTGFTVQRYSIQKSVLKWKKTKNAKKYQVYFKKEGGKYSLKGTTAKTSCRVSQSQGKTYYYKVRAVNGNKKGSFSAVKSCRFKVYKNCYIGTRVPDFGKVYKITLREKKQHNPDCIEYAYHGEEAIAKMTAYRKLLAKQGFKLKEGSGVHYVFARNSDNTQVLIERHSLAVKVMVACGYPGMPKNKRTGLYEGYYEFVI